MSDLKKEPLRILAPNPSPLTGAGTNSFLLGDDQVAVIDPGPDDSGHLDTIIEAGQGRISHIFVTHSHRDHSAGAKSLSERTGAPVLAFGTSEAGRSPVMQKLAAQGQIGGGEGLDMDFSPDILLTDGQSIEAEGWSLRILHTPGHCGNHLCLQWDDMLFCGDIILGWSSTLISPPDGDLTDFFRSLDRIDALSTRRLYPAHGDPIDDPPRRIAELVAHRRQRSAEILAALRDQPGEAASLAQRIYDVPAHLLPAASRNVLAHLVAMSELGVVGYNGKLSSGSRFYVT